MTLGFYYHITAVSLNGNVYLPSYLGLFVDSIAVRVKHLVLFLHEATDSEVESCNYALQSDNISWVNLGKKKPAWHRALFGKSLLKKIETDVLHCDAMLVRAPTPLSAAFFYVFRDKTPIVYMLVGDYVAGVPHLKLPFLRKWAIYAMAVYLDRSLKRAARFCCILSNSNEVLEKLKPFTKASHYIRTTTLSEKDFFERSDTCLSALYHVLYTGRFDFAKGLKELLEACASLIIKGVPIRLHLAGWEDTPGKPVVSWLEQRANALGIAQHVVNHEKKAHGEALNALYRSADIFVMPSYQEGFPRSIWEAMANGVPVIATAVGSIPHNLCDGKEALLIPPKQAGAIADKMELLIRDAALRKKLIANGLSTAREVTLESQSKILIDIIDSYLSSHH